MKQQDAQHVHERLGRLLGNPEHDSDCVSEESSRLAAMCTSATGRLSAAVRALLYAHRPHGLEDWQHAECAGDGVLCVDAHEEAQAYPCQTVRLIVAALDISGGAETMLGLEWRTA